MPQIDIRQELSRLKKTTAVEAPPPGSLDVRAELEQVRNAPPPPETDSFLGNVARSAGRQVEAIGSAIAHPVRTAKTLAVDLPLGLAEKALAPIVELDQSARGIGEDVPIETERTQLVDSIFGEFKRRYGSWQQLKHTAYTDPIGLAGDAATLVSGAGGAMKMGGVRGAAAVGRVASAIDPIQVALKTAAAPVKIAGKVVRRGAAMTSQTDPVALRQAFAVHSKDFTDAMRGRIRPEDIVDTVQNAYQELVSKRRADYESSFPRAGSISKEGALETLSEGLAEQRVRVRVRIPVDEAEDILAGTQYKIVKLSDSDDIFNLLRHKKLPGDISLPKGAKIGLDFEGSPIKGARGGESAVSFVFERTRRWKDRSLKGMDTLRRQIHNKLKQAKAEEVGAFPVDDPTRAIVNSVHQRLIDDISTYAPKYKDALRPYLESTEFLGELRELLKADKSKQTVLQKIREASKPGHPYHQSLIEALDTKAGTKLRDQVAGLTFSTLTPRHKYILAILWGIAHGLDPTKVVSMMGSLATSYAVFSPRAVGELTSLAGTASRGAGAVSRQVTAPRYRTAAYLPAPPEDRDKVIQDIKDKQ